MEKRKKGLHLTYIQFKKIISWCRDSYKKISGHKRTWQNVLNNKLSATVMERYRQGLREFIHRRQTKILLESWMEITGDFSGQLAGITAGKEREVGLWRRGSGDLSEERGDRRTKGHGIKDWISEEAPSGAAEMQNMQSHERDDKQAEQL